MIRVLVIVFSSLLPALASERAEENIHPYSQMSLVLIGESHAEPAGTQLVYRVMHKAKEKEIPVNFLLERDSERLGWAKEELAILINQNPSLLTENHPKNYENNHVYYNEILGKINPKLNHAIYSSWTVNEYEGKAKNRFWILKILHEFCSQVTPIDASYKETKEYFHKNIRTLQNQFNSYQVSLFEYLQPDKAMESNIGSHIRNLIILENINRQIPKNTLNLALLGLVHAGYIYENYSSPIRGLKTFINEEHLNQEINQTGVKKFYSQAQEIRNNKEETETLLSAFLK